MSSPIVIERYSLHSLPLMVNQPSSRVSIPPQSAVEKYLQLLLEFLYEEDSVRRFLFPPGRDPEAKTKILQLLDPKEFGGASDSLAQRLQTIQVEAVRGAIKFQEGDLLTVLYTHEGNRHVLLAKLEQQSYLNRQSWVQEDGFPFQKHRLMKTCLCTLRADEVTNACEIDEILIYDSNTPISTFWWRQYLEVQEETTDETNSRNAFQAMKDFIEQHVKPKSKVDSHVLKNSIAHHFLTHAVYKHSDMVNILKNYTPQSHLLDMDDLSKKAAELPSKSQKGRNRYDATFNIDPKACKIRPIPIKLTNNVDLVIRQPMENLKHEIKALKFGGNKGVFVLSDAGYAEFGGS